MKPVACIFLGHTPHFDKRKQPEADGNGNTYLHTHCERCGERMIYTHRNLWDQWRNGAL